MQPREIYQTEITNALVNAILDYTAPRRRGPGRMADRCRARDVVDRRFVPGDPSDTAITVILRIKGTDLNALRERTLTRDEARKRMDMKHY